MVLPPAAEQEQLGHIAAAQERAFYGRNFSLEPELPTVEQAAVFYAEWSPALGLPVQEPPAVL